MRAIWAIASKDLRLLARNRGAFFWVLGFPFLIALFFGAISSGGSGEHAPMAIAVADEDGTPYSQAFVAELRSSEALRVSTAPADAARQLVRQGKLVAYVRLPAGLGKSFGFGAKASGIELGIDPSRRAEAGYLKGLVTAAIFSTMTTQFTSGGEGPAMIRRTIAAIEADSTRTPAQRRQWAWAMTNLGRFLNSLDSARGLNEALGGSTSAKSAMSGPQIDVRDIVENENGPRSAYEVTFPSSVMWALIGVCMSFAISIVHERLRGTFLRLRLAPITRAQVLGGKALAAFVAALGTTTALLLVGATVFGIRITSPLQLLAALLASAYCFVGVMMAISVLGRTHQSVSGAGWAILLVMSMTGGGMIPLIAMPAWMQTVSNFSLVKWGVLAVEGAIWRGFSWSEMALPLGILGAVGSLALWFGAKALSRSDI